MSTNFTVYRIVPFFLPGLNVEGLLIVREKSMLRNCDRRRQPVTVKVPLMQWTHLCLVGAEKYIQVFSNGEFVWGCNGTKFGPKEITVSVGGGRPWRIGSLDISMKQEGSYVGEIVNPEVWTVVLPYKDIRDVLARCLDLSISPKQTQWVSSDDAVIRREINKTVPCREPQFDYVILPNRLMFDRNEENCQSFGMVTANPVTTDQLNELFEGLNSQVTSCFDKGVGGWLVPREAGDCRALSDLGTERTTSCTSKLCGLCQFKEKRPTFYLRGICPLEHENLSFVVAKQNNVYVYFQGVSGHVIVQKNDSWLLMSSLEGIILAEFPGLNVFGTQSWVTRSQFCDKPISSQVLASFNICTREQSWCNSGFCINAKQRCNGFADCDDGSDEENCYALASLKSAAMTTTPLRKKSVDVAISIDVLRILQMRDDLPIQAVIRVHLIWTDTETTFANVNRDVPTKIPMPVDFWTPVIMPSGQAPDPRDCISEECVDPIEITAFTNDRPMPDNRDNPNGGE